LVVDGTVIVFLPRTEGRETVSEQGVDLGFATAAQFSFIR
jgi:hypothetical protein